MANIKKLIIAVSLFSIQSNFCMDGECRTFSPLDDGYFWLQVENGKYIEDFAGKVIAWRSTDEYTMKGQSYKMDKNSPTNYGFVAPKGHSLGRELFKCVRKVEEGKKPYYSTEGDFYFNKASLVFVRALTIEEARAWNSALKAGTLGMGDDVDHLLKAGPSHLIPCEHAKLHQLADAQKRKIAAQAEAVRNLAQPGESKEPNLPTPAQAQEARAEDEVGVASVLADLAASAQDK
jgi:hypothetical protein